MLIEVADDFPCTDKAKLGHSNGGQSAACDMSKKKQCTECLCLIRRQGSQVIASSCQSGYSPSIRLLMAAIRQFSQGNNCTLLCSCAVSICIAPQRWLNPRHVDTKQKTSHSTSLIISSFLQSALSHSFVGGCVSLHNGFVFHQYAH